MNNGKNEPCVKFPEIPEIPSIQLLGGAELKSFIDFSQGMPTDCKLTFNLLLQLSPLLASMACLLKILDVIGKLQKFFTDLVGQDDPLSKLGKAIGDIPELLKAMDKLSNCIPLPGVAIPQIILMIKGILQLIINFMSCFLSQLDSIVRFQASIDLKAADGNPVLLASLQCARENSKISMDNLMLSLQPIQPLLDMVSMVGSIVGPPLNLPKISDISVNQNHAEVITSLREAIEKMKQVIDMPV